ncbi:MAG: nucleoside deaminase [Candidatus Paceibacterota bacterium]
MNDQDGFTHLSAALEQAKLSSADGNFPVGAVLVIDGKEIDRARNLLSTKSDWISHAEMNLLIKYSSLIKERRKAGATCTIYTTFEPCLMCLGACSLNRVSRIVYSCRDDFTGATKIDFNSLPYGYREMTPIIEESVHFKDESKQLILQYFNSHKSPKWDKAKEVLQNTE